MRPVFAVLALALLLAACGKKNGDEGKSVIDDALYARGETVFVRRCSTCHDLAGDMHRAGPVLAGINGRRAGTMKGFAYSQALQDAKITWTAETLDRWLQGPPAFVPGTLMQIEPITDTAERQALVEYLMNQ
jgi:cytochrome c